MKCKMMSILFIMSFSLTLSSCYTDILQPPATVTVTVSLVTTGIGASYQFADTFRAKESDFGAVMTGGGGTDSHPYLVYEVPVGQVDEFEDWAEYCKNQVDGVKELIIDD